LSTSIRSLLPSQDSSLAEANTWLEAEPVSPAPALTSMMLAATSDVPVAAS
jgi:hypothetical protein